MSEQWKPVCSGWYEVSEDGRLRRARYRSRFGRPGRILSMFKDKGGYLQVKICIDHKEKMHRIHQLVAEGFLGPRPSGLQINHKDGVKANNRADNLEYVTPKENIAHAMAHGLWPVRESTQARDARIREEYAAGDGSLTQLGKKYALSPSRIWIITKGIKSPKFSWRGRKAAGTTQGEPRGL